MAKQGMKRPDLVEKSKTEQQSVPEIQRKAKNGNKKLSNCTKDSLQRSQDKLV